MSNALTTRLSTKGQLILPKAMRDRRNWSAGTKLSVEETIDGLLIKALPPTKSATMEEIIGCVNYRGAARTIDEMNEGVLGEAKRQFQNSVSDASD